MKLKTSFFNTTVLKKDLSRFAPLWGLYSIFILLFVLLFWESEGSAPRFMNSAPDLLMSMGALNLCYAGITGFLLFGDLFKSRLCNALHAMPLRREGWFLTHLVAGLLFCLIPCTLGALFSAALLGSYCYGAFLWLGIMVLQFLFFFGIAAFSCMCTGNMLGAVAIYGLINFLAVLAGGLFTLFYQPFLYGIRLEIGDYAVYSPVVRFSMSRYLVTEFYKSSESTVLKEFIAEDWRYLFISAGVGIALLGCSVLLYRRRDLESAGDLIAFAPAKPVFLVLVSLCAGALLYFIAEVFSPALQYIFLFVGLAIGFFVGKMLLERRVQVFRGKNFLAFGILTAVFAATMGITALDPMGITRQIPEPIRVTSVTCNTSHYFYDISTRSAHITDPEDLQKVVDVHKDCLEQRDQDERHLPLYLRYELEDGTTMERYYYVDPDSDSMAVLGQLLSREEAIFTGYLPQYTLQELHYIEVYNNKLDLPVMAVTTDIDELNPGYYQEKYGYTGLCHSYLTEDPVNDPLLSGLIAALQADCAAGTMAQDYRFHDGVLAAQISLCFGPYSSRNYVDIQVYDDCVNTVAFLNSLENP